MPPAEELLYAFADHTSPTLLWAEEQMPRTEGTRTAGDIPHTVSNMQIVRLCNRTTAALFSCFFLSVGLLFKQQLTISDIAAMYRTTR